MTNEFTTQSGGDSVVGAVDSSYVVEDSTLGYLRVDVAHANQFEVLSPVGSLDQPSVESADSARGSTFSEVLKGISIMELLQGVQRYRSTLLLSALGFSGLVTLSLISGVGSMVQGLPLLGDLATVIGIYYLGRFAWNNLLYAEKRAALVERIDQLKRSTLG